MNNFFWSHTLLSPPPVVGLGYARLYNFPAASNPLFAPVGWRVPTIDDYFTDLLPFLGDRNFAGGKLKETGFLHWSDPNTGATNEFYFNGVGGGLRNNADGYFMGFKEAGHYHTSSAEGDSSYGLIIDANSSYFGASLVPFNFGKSVRLIKDNPSTWNPGDTVTDFDGNVYQTVKIGDQVWTSSNYKCTKLNDGTPIPLIEDNAAWAARTEMAQCIYGNDPGNL